MRKNKIIYNLFVEDIQTVALDNFGRELNDEEIKTITEPILKSINWYEIIYNSIKENLEIEEVDS